MKPRTISQKEVLEKWYIIDAKGLRIGRLATVAAELLLGKNDPFVRSNLNPNAKVVVINATKVDIAPKRAFTKFFKHYSGYPSGLRFESLEDKIVRVGSYPVEHAIKGMLPKNKRGQAIMANLKVYEGSEHPHEAQKPVLIDVKSYKL